MYWFRTEFFNIFLWLAVASLWAVGGWLATVSVFKLEKGHYLFVGFGLGLAAYLWLVNLLGRWLGPDVTFTGAGILVFVIGVGLALQKRKETGIRKILFENFDLLQAWPLFLAAIGLFWVFLLISQGVGMFDEFTHLPLISTLAAGDIPPRYFLNSSSWFAYHYGFQLFGASLMRLGGLFPWSAFDVSKSLIWAYAVVLAWLVGQNFGHKPWAGWLAALALVFASGTRYLLLLAPRQFLILVDPLVTFQGNEAGTTFFRWMSRIWEVEGAPPTGIPFAFLSGITEPLAIAHAGLHILHVIILLLVWFLAERIIARGPAIGVFTLLFSLWALTWESSYVLFLLGGGLATVYFLALNYWKARKSGEAIDIKQMLHQIHPAVWALLLSVPIVLVQGGLLTEIGRGFFTGGGGRAGVGMSLRWPPAIFSKHLGPLNLFSPVTLMVAIMETGPILFFLPWITRWGWEKFKTGGWVWGALLFSAWLGFLIPIFIKLPVGNDLSRIAAHAMLVFILFFTIQLTDPLFPTRFLTVAAASLVLMMFGGAMLFGTVLPAAGTPGEQPPSPDV